MLMYRNVPCLVYLQDSHASTYWGKATLVSTVRLYSSLYPLRVKKEVQNELPIYHKYTCYGKYIYIEVFEKHEPFIRMILWKNDQVLPTLRPYAKIMNRRVDV